MFSEIVLLALLARQATASISLLAFPQPNCNGQFTDNVRSDPADQFEASGCVATTGFESVQLVTAVKGYKCNIYSDLACGNFLRDIKDTTSCESVTGNSIICFRQEKFDNPLTGVEGKLFLSSNLVQSNKEGDDMLGRAAQQACGEVGCDPSSRFVDVQNPLIVPTTITVTMQGKYNSVEERDYMLRVLQDAFNQAQSERRNNPRAFLRGPSFTDLDDPFNWDIPTFGEAFLSDAAGRQLAHMSALITSEEQEKEEPCENTVGKISEAAIGAIPGIGGLAGLIFKITCVGLAKASEGA
jgi:hypothetical protein